MRYFIFCLILTSFLSAELPQEVILKAFMADAPVKGIMLVKTLNNNKPIEVKVYQEQRKKRWEYPGFVLLFDKNGVYKIIPDSQLIVILDKNLPKKEQNLHLLTQNYIFKREKEEKVAGLYAEKFKIISKSRNKISSIIWVYPENPVILKSIYFARNEEKLSESEFIKVEFPSDIDDNIFILPENYQVRWERKRFCFSLKEVENYTNFHVKEPGFIPEGFKLISTEVFPCPKGKGIAHLFYYDGVYTFSIFEHSTGCMPGMMGRMRKMMQRCMLPKSPYHKFLGNLLIVLEGELLPEEFEKVLSSF